MSMDNGYKEQIATLAQQVVQKGVDYSQVHVARLESEWSLAYRQEESNFIADKWFPQISVNQIAGLYPKWAKENAFTNKAGTWRPGSIPPQGELKVDTPGSYVCQRYAFEMPLLADLPYVADDGYPIEQATTQMVTDVLQLNKELLIASNYFAEEVWAIDWTGASSGETGTSAMTDDLTFRQFNDADSDPLGVFKDAKLAIKKSAGVNPNTLLMGEQVYEELRINPQLISMFRNPQGSEKVPTKLNEQMIAQALDVDNILVGKAMYNTAAPGATVSLDWIFGKHMWLGYVTQPGPLKTIAGMNLSFNEPLGGFDTALSQVPDLHSHTTYYQGFQCWCPVVMATEAGLFMKNAIA
jgi:hypothetical protein